MSETETTGGAQPDSSGTKSDATDSDAKQSQTEGKTVSFENHKRALDDMHKYKSKVREYEERLGNLEADRLKEKEDWKTLSERHEKERDDYKTKYEGLNSSLQMNEKSRYVRESAIKAGIRTEALDDLDRLDLNGVGLEYTTGGRMLVNGHEDFVEDLKKTRPFWFKDKKMPTINSAGGTTPPDTNQDLTAARFLELETKYKRENKPAELKALYQKWDTARAKRG
jgi:hypothetical protein